MSRVRRRRIARKFQLPAAILHGVRMTVLRFSEGEPADFSRGEVYFIGNATTLIRFGGLAILTDPAFMHKGTHTDLGHGIWARREVEPACQVADLPPIDLILLSHYHGDHFDDAAARDLDQDLPVISTADAVARLRPLGFGQGEALGTWESVRVEKGQATSPADTAFHYLAHGETYTFTPKA